jgi:cytochrome c2
MHLALRIVAIVISIGSVFILGLLFEHYKFPPYRYVISLKDNVIQPERSTQQRSIESSRVSISINTFPLMSATGMGGGIVASGETVLLIDKDGQTFVIHKDGETKKINFSIELGSKDLNSWLAVNDVSEADKQRFRTMNRVLDLELWSDETQTILLVSHTFFDVTTKAKYIRVSAVIASKHLEKFESILDGASSELVWESEPFPIEYEEILYTEHHGGRLVFLSRDSALLSVGDWHRPRVDKSADGFAEFPSIGKILKIELKTGKHEVYAEGLRNPQGLTKDYQGRVWSTEHGPEGGDELNLVNKGDHLGWPFATYGTDYQKHVWDLDQSKGKHLNYKKPIFSWVPSVALSQIIHIKKDWPEWQGDLLIATLARQSLLRLRVADNTVKYVEEIDIGHRIRDIVQLNDGEIVLWTDDSKILVLERESGASTNLRTACVACHDLQSYETRRGPSLKRFVSNGFGSDTNFIYSQSLLQEKGALLSEESFVDFVLNPQKRVPGTTMPASKVSAEKAREIYRALKCEVQDCGK